ncbi:VOC family protein [Paraburkholderia oxyphila]|uniref:VOC family protein n=1 Tax=Paraburkholderia oxyphila TaxID=614212 RepID=UPI0005BA6C2D|nr:VOC family protein [Paraburkholderia oxyphila]
MTSTLSPAVSAASPAAPDAANGSYFAPRRLGHVNLWVDDLGRSEAFYRDVCGLNIEFWEPDLQATFLGTGHTPHDLGMMKTTGGVDRYGRNGLLQLPGTIGLAPGLNHLAWELANEAELVAAWRRLKAAGMPLDLTVDHQVAHSVYVFDPDRNYNEFYCDTVKDWRSVLSGEMELLTSVWDPAAQEPSTTGLYDDAPVLRHVEGAAVHPRRITHAVLVTAKFDAMLDFYMRIGGLQVVRREPGAAWLGASHADYPYNLVLVEGAAAGYHHASFELAGEASLDAALDTLRARGIAPLRVVDLPWKRAFFLADPDGQCSEWYVRRDGVASVPRGGADTAWLV